MDLLPFLPLWSHTRGRPSQLMLVQRRQEEWGGKRCLRLPSGCWCNWKRGCDFHKQTEGFWKEKAGFKGNSRSQKSIFFSFQILRPRRIAIVPAVLINPLWISLSTSAIARGFKMACLSWHLQDKHCGASWDKQDRLLHNVLNTFVSSRLYHCCDITSAFCFSVSALLNCSHSKSDGRRAALNGVRQWKSRWWRSAIHSVSANDKKPVWFKGGGFKCFSGALICSSNEETLLPWK